MGAPHRPPLSIRGADGSLVQVLDYDEWAATYRKAVPERQQELDSLVRTGTFLGAEGRPLSERDGIVARQRMLKAVRGDSTGNYWGSRLSRGRGREPLEWLIPALWPKGWKPMLGGVWGSGKSKFIANLVAALEVPDNRLLGHFEPALLTDDERGRGTVVFNVENPPEAFEEELRLAGVSDEAREGLEVVHLLEEGGPGLLDLTDRDKFDYWVERLTYCEPCGLNDVGWSPHTVIVDGVTRILTEVGKSPAEYAAWYAAFRRLLSVIGTPNGLATGHTFDTVDKLMGGGLSMTLPDGRWFFTTDDPLREESARWFYASPRSIGPRVEKLRIVVSPEGPLRVMGGEAKSIERSQVSGLIERAQALVGHVRDHPGFLPDGVAAASEEVSEATRLGLIFEGDRCSAACLVCPADGEMRGRHNRRHFYVVHSDG